MTLPNFITIARIFMVPVIVWLLYHSLHTTALVVLTVASLTDAADGFIAKQFGQTSELGAYLDPLADKVLLVAIYVVMGVAGHFPAWLVIIVVSRDVAIVGAVMLSWLLSRPVAMVPHIVSKANTVAQFLFAIGVLAALAFSRLDETLMHVAAIFTAALTLASLAVYLREWLHHMANGLTDEVK